MNISHLRLFVAVAEELSFTRAARRLFMSASPSSRMVKELERELGAVLLERNTRHVQLTEAGARALPHIREILERIDALPRIVAEPSGAGRLRLGLAHGVHPVARDRLRRLLAGLKLEVVSAAVSTPALESLLQHGEIDIALLHLPIASRELRYAPLYGEVITDVAVASNHPLTRIPTPTVRDLRGHPWVGYKQVPMSQFYRAITEYFRHVGICDSILTPENDVTAAVNTVVDGRAFMPLPSDPDNPVRKVFEADPAVRLLAISDLHFAYATAAAWSCARAQADPKLRATTEAVATASARYISMKAIPAVMEQEGDAPSHVAGTADSGAPATELP